MVVRDLRRIVCILGTLGNVQEVWETYLSHKVKKEALNDKLRSFNAHEILLDEEKDH